MKKVLVAGVFDGLHTGHLSFFKQAKEYGDYLVVVVAKDKTVKRIKDCFPLKSEKERLKDIQKCEIVDEVRLGYFNNHYKIIAEVKPDIICFGYDQEIFIQELPQALKKMGLKVKTYRMKSYKPEKYHSSILNVRH